MSDYGCMLRAYRRTIVDAMLACHERSTFIPILANSFARHTTEILVHHAEREHGESKYSPMRLINLMFDLVTCMTTTPLRLLSIVGFGMAALGVLFAFALIVLAPGIRRRLGRRRHVRAVRGAVCVHRRRSSSAWACWVNTWAACTAMSAPARVSLSKRCCVASLPLLLPLSPSTALLPILLIRFSHE